MSWNFFRWVLVRKSNHTLNSIRLVGGIITWFLYQSTGGIISMFGGILENKIHISKAKNQWIFLDIS